MLVVLTAEQRSLRSRIAVHVALSRNDATQINARARQVYRDSFRLGHSCRLCPPFTMPAGLPDREVTRRAEALRQAHYARMALASSKARGERRRIVPTSAVAAYSAQSPPGTAK